MHWYGRELKFQGPDGKAEWGPEMVLCIASRSPASAKNYAARKFRGRVLEIRQERQGRTLDKWRRETDGRWHQVPTTPNNQPELF